jgi:NADH:ubiquinone oxidoreductase subunit 2 (subunit N)
VTLAILGCLIAAVLLRDLLHSILLLLVAGLAGVLLIADLPAGSAGLLPPRVVAAAVRHMLIVMLGAALLFVGAGFQGTAAGDQLGAGSGLLLAGFALWLGLVPFHLTLPVLLEETSLPVFAVVVGAFYLAVLVLLIMTLSTQQAVISAESSFSLLLLGLACLTAVIAPLQARGSPGRVVALLFVAATGLLTLGVALQTADGLQATTISVLGYGLAGALLVISGHMLEAPAVGPLQPSTALQARPLATTGLLVGLLALAGVPPLAGWFGRAELWQAAAARGTWIVLAVVVAQASMLLAAIRLARSALLRAPEATGATRSDLALPQGELAELPVAIPPYAPRAIRGVLLLLIVATLLFGLYPGLAAMAAEWFMRALPAGENG